jgi:hypothetical protein
MTVIAERIPIHGRGAVIMALGIASLVIFGPITGIPGWIMANQDLRDVDTGYIHSSERPLLKTGKLLSILGTFCSPLWLILFVASMGMLFFILVTMALSV